ncbi:hypothetical protein EVAR_81794_1 [Eumeta japonica]|uniref:Uncharacterized protein n=1 Tax=Eumeta variegata TaxID=151549 RepID=A0A4C1UHW1_EUMVA|nr:hypothetical protein EVAR_81794_1 [Eumeta japonica]
MTYMQVDVRTRRNNKHLSGHLNNLPKAVVRVCAHTAEARIILLWVASPEAVANAAANRPSNVRDRRGRRLRSSKLNFVVKEIKSTIGNRLRRAEPGARMAYRPSAAGRGCGAGRGPGCARERRGQCACRGGGSGACFGERDAADGGVRAMWWRRQSRGQRAAALLTAYAMLYVTVSWWTVPGARVRFVGAEARGERLPRVLLTVGGEPLSDAEGVALCEGCFVTNNRGFLPSAMFDAVVGSDGGEGARRYDVVSGAACLRRKLRRCAAPPLLAPAAGGAPLTLCALCAALRSARPARAPS